MAVPTTCPNCDTVYDNSVCPNCGYRNPGGMILGFLTFVAAVGLIYIFTF